MFPEKMFDRKNVCQIWEKIENNSLFHIKQVFLIVPIGSAESLRQFEFIPMKILLIVSQCQQYHFIDENKD